MRFDLREKLGRGGFGEVWKAWDPQLNRWVALKFLTVVEGEELARFQREARLAASLSHPNIAAVYEVGESDGRPFIAMQFIDGRTLRHADPTQHVRLIRDAARAVHLAHEKGIVHRDLKPENLMVSEGRLFVLDFGLARQTSVASSLSASGFAVGTPAYMSPEQARGDRVVDARSDVYSLGRRSMT